MHSTVKLIKVQPATDLQLYMSALQKNHLAEYGAPFFAKLNLRILEVVR